MFDDLDNKEVTKNNYMGVQCHCREEGKKAEGASCDHQHLIADMGVVNFVLNSSIDGKTGEVGERFKNMTDDEIKYYQLDCKIFFEPKGSS